MKKEIAVGIKLNARWKDSNEIILPAYMSDGYFNLLPGETRVIEVEIPCTTGKNIYISAEGLNVALNS